MATVHFDGKAYEVKAGRNLLEAALDHHLDLPYFCWHPAMGSVGACRQCAVRAYRGSDDRVGKIVMACMTPAADGARADIGDPEAVQFRRAVIEWLMINHPHDCPVCDEGGECHLQDMTVMTGHVYRRYRGRKRTYRNQDLGPFVTHEMNRCIQCYRCVRFYRGVAGGRDFDVFSSRNRVYFGRFEDGPLESEFAGNLVEVCPTGVFTDKTLARHYTRKWDLETAPSVCPHCALGCNTTPGARYGEVRRVQNRYHPEVNGYFLCDRGRFGYEFMTRPARIRQASSRQRGPLARAEALAEAAALIRGARRVVGVGSGRASLEANHALRRLCGEEGFSTGLPSPLHAALEEAVALFREGPARPATLARIEDADAVLLLWADPTGEAPRLDLAIRQAVRGAMYEHAAQLGIPRWNDDAVKTAAHGRRHPLHVLAPAPVKLEEIAQEVVHADPARLVTLARGLEQRIRGRPGDGTAAEGRIAASLRAARRPAVVVSALAGAPMVRAAGAVASALHQGGRECALSVVAPEANSLGVQLLGGRPLEAVLEAVEGGEADVLVTLEYDLFRWCGEERLSRALPRLQALIALDAIATGTTRAATLVLPAAPYAESTGTFVSQEGRAQRFFQVFVPEEGDQEPSWSLLGELLGSGWRSHEDVIRELAAAPGLEGVLEAAPLGDWRLAQMKIARQPPRFSGRTAVHADRTVFEPIPEPDPDTPFVHSAEGLHDQKVPGALAPRFWAPGWNSMQALTRFQDEVNGPLRGGNPGRRLLEPGGGGGERRGERPILQAPAKGELWVVPVPRTFGSEELSRLAPAIAERTAPAALWLHPEEAGALGVGEGDAVDLHAGGAARRLPVRLHSGVARGVAAVPLGYPETQGLVSAAAARLRRAP
jgi:NADH-quinone oxidoreductase subunit G